MRLLILIALAAASATAIPQLTFKCSTAMVCVDLNMCDRFGVMTKTPVTLTEDEEQFRHPLVPCVKKAGGDGVCCRDPDYKDDWPTDWVDPGRMSFEEYMALRIKKMVYTSTSPKPVPSRMPSSPTSEPRPVLPPVKPVLPPSSSLSDGLISEIPLPSKQMKPPAHDIENERPRPVQPSSLDDSIKSTPKSVIIGYGRIEESSQQFVTSNPQSTVKILTDDSKVDRSYAGPPPPVEVVQSKPFIFHEARDATKQSENKPERPIVVVSNDAIEVHANPKQLDIVSIEQTQPLTKPVKQKKVVFSKDISPKKRVKVSTEPTITTPVPVQAGLHPLLLTGCPRRNRTAMPDLNTQYDDTDFDAGAGEFPWQAAVFDRKNKFLCGCFFTEEDTCVTTASCVEGLKATDIKVVVGIYDINNPTKVKEVPSGNKAAQILDCEAIDRHAYFSSKTKQYDLAVLFITQTVALNYFTLPICIDRPEGIPVSRRITAQFDDCVATGWGRDPTYHWFDVQLLSENECASLVPGFDGGMQSCARPSVKLERNVCEMIETGSGFQCRYMGDRMSRKNDIYWLKGTLSECIAEKQVIVYSHLDLDWFEETINARRYHRSHLWRQEESCRF